MKRIHYLLFLLFYFASSYAVTQERARMVVGEVQDSTSESDQARVEDGSSQARDSFPNYRQARPRVISIVDVELVLQHGLMPSLSEGFLPGSSKSPFQSLHDGGSFLSRAPPFEI